MPTRPTFAATVLVLACILGAPLARDVTAQEVRGTLIAAEMDMPLPFGVVELLDTTLAVVASAFADELGRFALVAPGPGPYNLRGSHMNASPLFASLVLGPDQVVTVELALPLRPFELDSLLVTVAPEHRFLVRNGFYGRAQSSLGTFITPELMERWRPFRATDMLRRLPGVRITPLPGSMRYSVAFTRQMFLGGIGSGSEGGRLCGPKIVVDGMTMLGFDLDNLPIQTIQAIEVYKSPLQVPPEFGGPSAACGVIAVWTGIPRER